jgi:hypothetical protein
MYRMTLVMVVAYRSVSADHWMGVVQFRINGMSSCRLCDMATHSNSEVRALCVR